MAGQPRGQWGGTHRPCLLCPAAARCPVTRALPAPSAPSPLLATTGVSSWPPRIPAAAHLAGWYEGGAWGCGAGIWGPVCGWLSTGAPRSTYVRGGICGLGEVPGLWIPENQKGPVCGGGVPAGAFSSVDPSPHRAPSAPCPVRRASMDPTAHRNVAVTTVASATHSLGSVTVLQATLGTGEWPWCGLERRGRAGGGRGAGGRGRGGAGLTGRGAQVP